MLLHLTYAMNVIDEIVDEGYRRLSETEGGLTYVLGNSGKGDVRKGR